MSLIDLFRRNDVASQGGGHREIISRYKHLRTVGIEVNNKLVSRLSKEALQEGARKLGMLRRGMFVFDSEDETSVLMDYCLHDVRSEGRNAIEHYLIDSPPELESDEMACLRAKQHSIYSLFMVESVERGFGVRVRDLLSNEVHFVVDIGLGSTCRPDLVFASRLLRHDNFTMTGGAALPVGILHPQQRDSRLKQLVAGIRPDKAGHFDPAPLIRACLSLGSSAHVRYQDPTGHLAEQQRLSNESSIAKVPRNASCPCGSGKKFKNCCMKRV
jgi:hypothetical protein